MACDSELTWGVRSATVPEEPSRMMIKNFELRQKSTGDMIVSVDVPEYLLCLRSSAMYSRSCSDATRYSALATGSGICVTWRVSIAGNRLGSRVRAGGP